MCNKMRCVKSYNESAPGDCGHLYLYFKKNLGKEFVEPLDAADLPQFRLLTCTTAQQVPL